MLKCLISLFIDRTFGRRPGGRQRKNRIAVPPNNRFVPSLVSFEDRTVPSAVGSSVDQTSSLMFQQSLQNLISSEGTLVTLVSQQASLGATAPAQLQQEISTLVNTEAQLTNLVSQEYGVGSASGSGSVSGSGSGSISGSASGSASGSGSISGSGSGSVSGSGSGSVSGSGSGSISASGSGSVSGSSSGSASASGSASGSGSGSISGSSSGSVSGSGSGSMSGSGSASGSVSGSASGGNLLSGLIGVETELVNEVSQIASSGMDIDSSWFGPVVDQLSGLQNQLTVLLSVEGSADPSYQTDLASLVNNENTLTNLLVQVAASGSNPIDS